MATPEQIDAGQAVYSSLVLRFYDILVLGLSNHLLWRCPTAAIAALYDRNLSAEHLDVGVGTGYFLDRGRWPVPHPSITLLDLNPNCLEAAARRLRRFRPRVIRANVLAPFPSELGPFHSASLGYLLHCLPGTIGEKAVVFDHLSPILAPGARVFGATILQGDTVRSKPAQALMDFYNRKGVFSNKRDTADDLGTALRDRFDDVRIEIRGTVALFEARAG